MRLYKVDREYLTQHITTPRGTEQTCYLFHVYSSLCLSPPGLFPPLPSAMNPKALKLSNYYYMLYLSTMQKSNRAHPLWVKYKVIKPDMLWAVVAAAI